ncbi:hypothetical protein [Sphingomonas pruni]|uniref:hypothetical protein n=1 Tax=Sphingomonas pruni TaxID=40683 RepID=UPI000A8259B5|nr:hypothetical protein [Sphingomonas pruni]
MKRIPAVVGMLLLSGCFWGSEYNWADEKQIIDAAKRCGVEDLKPTKAGDAWAAYVPDTVPDHARKEDCIYNDLHKQGLLVTR